MDMIRGLKRWKSLEAACQQRVSSSAWLGADHGRLQSLRVPCRAGRAKVAPHSPQVRVSGESSATRLHMLDGCRLDGW